MRLDDLLSEMEAQSVTPVTDTVSNDVTPEALQTLPFTPVTSVTAEIDTSFYQESYAERAAILEYDNVLPRHEAEYWAEREIFHAFAVSHYPHLIAFFESIISQSKEHII